MNNTTAGAVSTPTLVNVAVYITYMIQGVLIPAGNYIIVIAIARYEALRNNKEYVIISGLALADGTNMLGYFFAGYRRLQLYLNGEYNTMKTALECLQVGHNIFWSLGMRLSSMMLTVVSADRLLAVLFPIRYVGWTGSYARRLVAAVYTFNFLNVVYYSVRVFQNPDVPVHATCPIVSMIRDTSGRESQYFKFYQFTSRLFPILTVFFFLIVMASLRRYYKSNIFLQHLNQEYELKRQRRITVTLLISAGCTFLLYVVPLSIALKLFSMGKVGPAIVFMSISNLNSLANLFVYPLRHREVRQAIRALFMGKHMPADLKMWTPNVPAQNVQAIAVDSLRRPKPLVARSATRTQDRMFPINIHM